MGTRRVYYDTEFLEDGRTVDLISIGMVDDRGNEYYAVVEDAPWRRIRKHPWLMENVVPHLPQPHGEWILHMPKRWLIDFYSPRVKPRAQIAEEVRDFLAGGGSTPSVSELWADYAAYDHVALCQLWGTMMDLPRDVPMWTHDLQQELDHYGRPALPPQASGLHNALADARYVRDCVAHLESRAA